MNELLLEPPVTILANEYEAGFAWSWEPLTGPVADINETPAKLESERMENWPDARLIEGIRGDPPSPLALEELARRYHPLLMRHCFKLAFHPQLVDDLAQDTWYRLLRARRELKPDGNFRAYLRMISTNLWRDACRSSKRNPLINQQCQVSLDSLIIQEEAQSNWFNGTSAHQAAYFPAEHIPVKMDIQQALSFLSPELRDVLIARFIRGETCAEIGCRYQRTQQTVNGWVRKGIQLMKQHLNEGYCE